jgi:hypothetical protein
VIVWARERLTHASSDANRRVQRIFKHPPGAEPASDLEEGRIIAIFVLNREKFWD